MRGVLPCWGSKMCIFLAFYRPQLSSRAGLSSQQGNFIGGASSVASVVA